MLAGISGIFGPGDKIRDHGNITHLSSQVQTDREKNEASTSRKQNSEYVCAR